MPARIAAVLVAGLAYVLGIHWLMTRGADSPWSVVGILSPMLAAIAIGAWRSGQRAIGGAAALAIAALCALALHGTVFAAPLLYLAQHVGIHLSLALAFASTLRAGRTPQITRLAARVYRMTPGRAAYTRKLTFVWVAYFVAMALISIGLYVFAPFETWAFFANLLTPLSLVLMFVVEHLLRYRLHPEFERASLAQAIRAYTLEKTQEPTA